jgi:hypothetical protein
MGKSNAGKVLRFGVSDANRVKKACEMKIAKLNFKGDMVKFFRIKNSILLLALAAILVLGSTVHAQHMAGANLTVTPLKKGMVKLKRGRITRVVDLSKDVSGCILVNDGAGKKFDSSFFVGVDSVIKNGKTYLVLLAQAGASCNVMGYAGADTDLTLIWLKMNSRLQVEDKKAVVVESRAFFDVGLVSPQIEVVAHHNTRPFKLINGKLRVRFETNPHLIGQPYSLSTLRYHRTRPEKGLAVKTVKLTRPTD